MSALRVACAGAGYFSRFHFGSWARLDDVEVVGACDLDVALAEATGHPAFSDLHAMLAEVRPDLLDIILPPVAHAEAIAAAVEHGVAWVICQKPFCRDLAEAERVTQMAEDAGMRLIVHENFRFQPWYRALKTRLDDGLIGRVQQLTFRLRPGDGQGPDAYLDRQPYFQTMTRFLVHETAVHWLDTFRFLCGEVDAVYADLRRVNPAIAGEDAGLIVMDHVSGIRTVFDGNRTLDHASDNLRRTMGEAWAEGDAGTIRLTGDGALWHRAFGAQAEACVLEPSRHEGFGGDCVHALKRHVIAAIRHGAEVENEALDYLRVLALEEAVYRSAERHQKIRV